MKGAIWIAFLKNAARPIRPMKSGSLSIRSKPGLARCGPTFHDGRPAAARRLFPVATRARSIRRLRNSIRI